MGSPKSSHQPRGKLPASQDSPQGAPLKETEAEGRGLRQGSSVGSLAQPGCGCLCLHPSWYLRHGRLRVGRKRGPSLWQSLQSLFPKPRQINISCNNSGVCRQGPFSHQLPPKLACLGVLVPTPSPAHSGMSTGLPVCSSVWASPSPRTGSSTVDLRPTAELSPAPPAPAPPPRSQDVNECGQNLIA